MLFTLSVHNIICQLYLNKAAKKKKSGMQEVKKTYTVIMNTQRNLHSLSVCIKHITLTKFLMP